VPPQHTHARVEERYKPHTNSVASKISRIDIVGGTCAIIADNVPIADLGTSMAGEGGGGGTTAQRNLDVLIPSNDGYADISAAYEACTSLKIVP
jgi:hypothetical protein